MKESIRLQFSIDGKEDTVFGQVDHRRKEILLPSWDTRLTKEPGTVSCTPDLPVDESYDILFEDRIDNGAMAMIIYRSGLYYVGPKFPTFGPLRANEMAEVPYTKVYHMDTWKPTKDNEIDECYRVENVTKIPVERYVALLHSVSSGLHYPYKTYYQGLAKYKEICKRLKLTNGPPYSK